MKTSFIHGVGKPASLGTLPSRTSRIQSLRKPLPSVNCYADDTQLYLAFQPDDTAAQESAVASMEVCIQDIRNWMTKA